MQRDQWWALPVDEVLKQLEVSPEGLSSEELQKRREIYGANALPTGKKLSLLRIFARQFSNPILSILAVAGTVTLALQHWKDAITIFAAVLLNASLGLYQEAKAENTLELLKKYVKEEAQVLRDGKRITVLAHDLVPGDIVDITQGNRIPADGRLLQSTNLQVDEAVLTGESLAVEKQIDTVAQETALADRTCMVFSGTTVVQGFARMVVTATGSQTELGRIAGLVQSAEHSKTPLQKALLSFTYKAAAILGFLTLGLFAYGVWSGQPAFEMFLVSVAIAVAAVPEGLPIALTVILAIGVERLARKKGVVRKLLAAETLGSTTVILTDKTGTLTQAKMELEQVIPFGTTLTQERLLEFAISHSDVVIENPDDPESVWRMTGRPTEIAIARSGAQFGVHAANIKSSYEVIQRVPFNSRDKFSASVVKNESGMQVIALGAPEAVLRKTNISQEKRDEVMATVDALAEGGARVLALAVQEVKSLRATEEYLAEASLELVGLLAFRDPIRESAKEAITRVQRAGVRVIVVTGDHAGTATHIAQEVGITLPAQQRVLLGGEIDELDDLSLKKRLRKVAVIARTTPEHKLRIAHAFKGMGEVVAMTGDGVNDAPALQEANIGVAVGSGTDVAKAAADLVILDDDFATIVAAVEEGRNVLQNVRKVIAYVLSNAFDGLFLIGGSIALGIPLPLSTVQILWVNLFTGSFPAMALAFERNHGDMGKGPVRVGKTIFDAELRFLVCVVGAATSLLLFVMYSTLLRWGYDPVLVRTFIFASFGVYTLFLAFSLRSLRTSILKIPLFENRYLIGGAGIGFMMMTLAIYVPQLQGLFGTVSLTLPWLVGVVAFGLVSIIGTEIGKFLYKNYRPVA